MYESILNEILDDFRQIAERRIEIESGEPDPDVGDQLKEHELAALEVDFLLTVEKLRALLFGDPGVTREEYDRVFSEWLDEQVRRRSRLFKTSRGGFIRLEDIFDPENPMDLRTKRLDYEQRMRAIDARIAKLRSNSGGS